MRCAASIYYHTSYTWFVILRRAKSPRGHVSAHYADPPILQPPVAISYLSRPSPLPNHTFGAEAIEVIPHIEQEKEDMNIRHLT